MTDAPYSVPAFDTLMATARAINDDDPSVLDSEITRFSDEIGVVLNEMRDGDRELDKATETELQDLYTAWAEDGYPMPDDGYDEVQEGGEKGIKSLPEAPEDLDIDLDPQAAPQD